MKIKQLTTVKKINKGFTLLELILVLSIGTLAFIGLIQQDQKRQESLASENAGGQIYEVGQALAQYINMNNSILQAAVPIGTTTAAGAVTLAVLQQPATTTTNIGGTLVPNRLLLPTTYLNTLGFPTVVPVTYNLYLRNTAGTITGLVLTNTAIIDKSGATRYDWAGAAMKKAGGNAGLSFGLANQLNGLNGIWTLTNAQFPDIDTLGKIGYRVAYQATFDSTYLRLDGMYPMNGNLNMGNYSIKNATDISYTGWLYGNNGVMNNLLTGTITNAGNITTNSINGKTTLLTAANAATYANNISPAFSYSNFDLLYANCINCGFPTDTGTANISTIYNANNGDVRIGANGNTGTLFVKDIILGGNGGSVVDSRNALLSDRLPRYADRGVAIAADGGILAKPVVTTAVNATGYVCRWTGQGNAPVPKIEVIPSMQWSQGAVLGAINLNFAGSGIDAAGRLVLNGSITQNQYTLGALQTYAVDNGASWTIYSRTPDYHGGFSGGTALVHVYCDYGN